ncbi:MAG: hypothetical protein KDN19_21270 [Verrucomicrobiae bacterium]|nr:hypothetical protein [Verrucomicrobiae bacterium]
MHVHELFTAWDWLVVAAYLAFTTWIGHLMRGKQATIRDFFLGGRSLPWLAVCGSIIATEISALTFIGVPANVFSDHGDFRYIQWAFGSIIARVIVGVFFVRLYYQREIYSPYDYIGNSLGSHAKSATTILFWLGAILGQSVRVLVTAIILKAATGLPVEACIGIVGVFAILWTLMGGMRTVIWTDVVQFFIFFVGGLVCLFLIIQSVGGWGEYTAIAGEAGKFRWLDTTLSATESYTLWIGILAMPFQNVTAFGLDQLMAQRMFCCRDAGDARKAIIASSASQIITLIMLAIGAGLYVYYRQHPLTEEEAGLIAEERNTVFPIWIITNLPPGVSGLILAGAFAAAISSLDSVLAALAQTSLSLFSKRAASGDDDSSLVGTSRLVVCGWGIGLTFFTWLLYQVSQNEDLISLAFGMLSYTYGPLLGIFLLAAVFRKSSTLGLTIGISLSVLFTLWLQPQGIALLKVITPLTDQQIDRIQPDIHWAWMFPISCLLTVICGLIFGKPKPSDKTSG